MFTYLYSKEGPCDSGVTNYFFVPQLVKKAYAAFGYNCIYLSNTQIKKNFQAVMNAIKSSIDNGGSAWRNMLEYTLFTLLLCLHK